MAGRGRPIATSVAAVLVSTAASVVTNLVVDGWPVVLVLLLSALTVAAALLEAIKVSTPGTSRQLSLRAKATGDASIIQVGGDVVTGPSGRTDPPAT